MGNERFTNEHPKTQEQAFWEAHDIVMLADKGLRGNEQVFDEIKRTMEAMTPVERMAVAKNFYQGVCKNINEKDVRSIPCAEVTKDSKGDITSLSFTSVSDDAARGNKAEVNLANRNTSHGEGAKEFKLGNDVLRVAKYDNDGNLTEIQDSDGGFIVKSEDGSWTRSTTDADKVQLFTDFKVMADGSMTYKVKGFEDLNEITERVNKNGDTVISDAAQSLYLIQYKDGSIESRTAAGDIIKSADGNQVILVPEGGGSVTMTRTMDNGKAQLAMDVEFPDGFRKSYNDMTADEFRRAQSATSFDFVWLEDHRFGMAFPETGR